MLRASADGSQPCSEQQPRASPGLDVAVFLGAEICAGERVGDTGVGDDHPGGKEDLAGLAIRDGERRAHHDCPDDPGNRKLDEDAREAAPAVTVRLAFLGKPLAPNALEFFLPRGQKYTAALSRTRLASIIQVRVMNRSPELPSIPSP